MELSGKDLFNYGLLREYAKYELERDPENALVHKWVDKIRKETWKEHLKLVLNMEEIYPSLEIYVYL